MFHQISKCMERCVYKHIHNHLLDNDIITTCQSGFTKGDSAVNQLINIANMSSMVLRWSTSKIVFSDPDLGSKILKNWPLKDHPCHVCFKLAYWFQRRRFLNIFPIGSYVKTMFAEANWIVALQEWSLGGPVPNLWIICWSEIQNSHHDST
jgi:hypothetical protein